MTLTTADSSSALLDSSLPLSSVSSFPALTSTYDTFFDPATWNSLSLPSAGTEQLSGNALQHGVTSGDPPLVMTTEEQISLMAMTSGTQSSFNTSMCTPMEPSKEPIISSS